MIVNIQVTCNYILHVYEWELVFISQIAKTEKNLVCIHSGRAATIFMLCETKRNEADIVESIIMVDICL